MVDFRRWITALAWVTLFLGLASAQTASPQDQSLTVTAHRVTIDPQPATTKVNTSDGYPFATFTDMSLATEKLDGAVLDASQEPDQATIADLWNLKVEKPSLDEQLAFAIAADVFKRFPKAGGPTLLLFPFVTNSSGFDTGFSIANTESDPIRNPQNCGCTMRWYDGSGNEPAVTTAKIDSPRTHYFASAIAPPNFTGYMFAECNFMAHGSGFISDLAMPYLALVLPTAGNPPVGNDAEQNGHAHDLALFRNTNGRVVLGKMALAAPLRMASH